MKIIRTRQRPFLIVIDAFFTILAWIGLLYLVVRGLWPLIDTHDGPRIDASFFDALGTLQIYLWVALFNAVVLISWARYQHRKSKSFAQRRLPAPVVDDHGLSKSFKLTGDRLEKLRTPGSMTIHNNQDGDVSHVISHYVPINPARQPPPLAPLEHPLVIRLPAEDDDNREPLSRH
ncbi:MULTISPECIES: poly-beta-1,6-N-acetyl-D-glucosamine biosynthesis protein PgaD [unclassified Pseudomonas]|uniref:poly-beta-1,6-N-acetyl-D-glucosamine biosynthesis protein PgaD n=1 Tax=unclassified Pseudomonas TaxID=196821 RepID=UPI0019137B97|nr:MULTISPECIES: poly-beta-1,6-N-acetyl-D-glucosamine biosynthesis protein PgaD [unclassified Pseudomonas]MBK5549829.1 poly-beta-1,6-N-acetyl-D-glucosamine biosynthesis protein PgaD [Pseudomonas sp. TH03]MEB0224056.1 poly-beta-1,6-N-acetyl-D-glucosamine biosynthesis protein PgaD [Pseudomonas sp. 5S1]MEB0296271.1 poly-beta-1,6-N-acetyl-D-glucosamine biosynthesis protein PgaD [Pseudomonas sp. 10S4]WPX20090.1 poly-beta-1,6-N-acetyl-D-glucosamine biosynthesis protein PgaD [Pseudomonas sp. 10S4]